MGIHIMSYNVDDRVSIDHPKYPGTWIVKKLGPVNAVLEPENGGRQLRAPQSMLREPGAIAVAAPPKKYYNPGNLVRIASGKWAGLWVVIADRGGATIQLVQLGGSDDGRYLRSPRVGLELVEVPKCGRHNSTSTCTASAKPTWAEYCDKHMYVEIQ